MKKIIITMFLIAAQAFFSMAYANDNDFLSASEELVKLKYEKLTIESESKKQEAACYKKFAVSNCLQEVKTTTQTSLSVIKRRELELKDSQRNAKIESHDKKQIDSKNAPTPNAGEVGHLKSDAAKTKQIKSIRTEDEILADKKINDKLRMQQAKRRVDDSSRKLAQAQQKQQIRESKISHSTSNLARYNQKIALAAAKKAELEKVNSERKKPTSAPLPIPSNVSAPMPPVTTQ